LIRVAVCIGAVSGGLQQFAAPPQVLEPRLDLTPSEIEIYKRAKTLIDWTPRQVHDYPLLHKLRPSGSQDQLPIVLERVGQTVTVLFHDFPRVACDEEVLSQALYEAHRRLPPVTAAHKFRYIVIPRPGGDVYAFDEYRTDLKGNPFDASSFSARFMITSGYTSTCGYLSPADQHGSRLRYFGIQTIRNRECHVVGFAQEPEKAYRVGGFRIGGDTVVMLVQGLAWIDSETFQILRIATWLLAPRTDIGLSYQASTVDFYPVQPRGSERVLWLPRDVTVVIGYRRVQFRNTHRYSNFKLFRVDSTIKSGG
jgi:hypothetical protein